MKSERGLRVGILPRASGPLSFKTGTYRAEKICANVKQYANSST